MALWVTVLSESCLLSSFVVTFFYGVYLIVAFRSSIVLYRRYRDSRGHVYLVATHILLFILISLYCVVIPVRILQAFNHTEYLKTGGRKLFNFGDAVVVVKIITWVATIIIADAFMVYRVCVVWHKYWSTPLLIMVIANLAVGVWWIHTVAIFNHVPATMLDALSPTIFCALTVAINVLSSGLIAFCIIRVKRTTQGLTEDRSLNKVAVVLIESAAVPTILSICSSVFLALELPAAVLAMEIQPPIFGIAFLSIILRISNGSSHGDAYDAPSSIRFRSYLEDTEPNLVSTGSVTIRLAMGRRSVDSTVTGPVEMYYGCKYV